MSGVGIIGLGKIGRATAKLACAFGMKVVGYDVVKPSPAIKGCQLAGLEDVFREADVVSLHCPLTPETEGLVNKGRLLIRSVYLTQGTLNKLTHFFVTLFTCSNMLSLFFSALDFNPGIGSQILVFSL